jgi:hypothetical protein
MITDIERELMETIIKIYFKRENFALVARFKQMYFNDSGTLKMKIYRKFLEYALNDVFLKLDLKNAFRRCWNNFEEYLEYNKEPKKN